MFDSFGIMMRRLGTHPDGHQECNDQAVAFARLLGQAAPGVGQKDAPIRAANDQPLVLKAGYGLGNGGMRDAESLSGIHGSRLAVLVDQISNELRVVVGRFGAMCLPGLPETLRPVARGRRSGGGSLGREESLLGELAHGPTLAHSGLLDNFQSEPENVAT